MENRSLKFKLLLLLTLFQAADLEELGEENNCSDFCVCVETESQKLQASCNITGLENTTTKHIFGRNPSRIHSLDLSSTSLRVLYTRVIQNLTHLTTLNLQFNDISSFYGNVSRDLPNLTYINVTGNKHWLPSNELLGLSKLRRIEGVWWRKECGACFLVKKMQKTELRNNCNGSNSDENRDKTCADDSEDCICGNNKAGNNKTNSTPKEERGNEREKRDAEDEDDHEHEDEDDELEFPYPNIVKYGQIYRFYKHNFNARCEYQDLCNFYEVFAPADNARFTVFTGLRYILYSLGAVAMSINLVVIVTVIARTKLRKSPSFVLVAILASSDFLTGLYSTLQAKFTSFISFHQQELQAMSALHEREVICDVSGYIFTTAQVTSPMTSLLLTIERYLVIVYGLNPEKRLTRKKALLYSLIGWIVAIVIAAGPFFLKKIKYREMSHCSLPNTYETNASLAVDIGLYVVTSGLMVPYVIGILLYTRIYVIVKKSGQEMGNRSDLQVAKKISLIVFSNLIFFVIPTVLLYFHSNFYNDAPESFTATLTAHRAYLFVFSCLPLLCFNINSCLNPFLFALRNKTFKEQLVRLVTGVFTRGSGKEGIRSYVPTIHPRSRLKTHETSKRNSSNRTAAGQSDISLSYSNEGIQLEEKNTMSDASHGSLRLSFAMLNDKCRSMSAMMDDKC